ncbi:LysR family transcriptional regulator [Vibrio coralliirubri]|uniref:LysR family transcriptional regulator n=1 Tax=Vibrio coralliirubri TaxID=1516159 RepID=UPI00065E19E2|nr:LysR family transcriptional regulator [Vibrio coralliirubri]
MQIQSKEVLFFVEVTNFSSFSDAAEAMNIPQPTVSRRILALEGKIKSQLFLRSKSGVVLTEFGLQFLNGALEVKQSLNALKKIANQGEKDSKVVIVEALQPLAILLMNSFLPFFRKNYPDIVVDLKTLKNNEQAQNLGDAIRLQGNRVDVEHNRVIHFLQAKRNCYVSARLWVEHPEIEHPRDILGSDVPCIDIQQPKQVAGRWRYYFDGEYHELKVTPSLIVDDAIKAREALLNDMGISWNVDVLMKEAVKNGEAVELFDSSYSCREDAYITYKSSKELSEPEQISINTLRSYYSV